MDKAPGSGYPPPVTAARDPRRLLAPLLASLTLGLAPFVPEPHIWGKLRWLAGGGAGMQAQDYFDVVLHGAPWVWLLFALGRFAVGARRT